MVLTFSNLPGKNKPMSVTVSYVSKFSGVAFGTHSESRLVRDGFAPKFSGLLAALLVLGSALGPGRGAESNAPPPAAALIAETNLQEVLRAQAQLQEAFRATQQAVDQNGLETKAALARTAEALSKAFETAQDTFAAQRTRDWEVAQRSNRAMLIVASAFAVTGLLALVVMTYFQWRASSKLTRLSTGWLASGFLGPGPQAPALGPGDWRRAAGDPAGQSNLRLLEALEQLDQRLHAFKRAISSGGNGLLPAPDRASAAKGFASGHANEECRIPRLLNQANALLGEANVEAAIACLDEVLAQNPDHTEALVKKGAALERLHKLNEAIECYDRAIAVDESMTLAHLHKGGLCNRLERFKEALECYEKALRTHDQRTS